MGGKWVRTILGCQFTINSSDPFWPARVSSRRDGRDAAFHPAYSPVFPGFSSRAALDRPVPCILPGISRCKQLHQPNLLLRQGIVRKKAWKNKNLGVR